MGALLIAAAACTPEPQEQPTPNEPLPEPSPQPPVEEVEQRLVSLVKITPEYWGDYSSYSVSFYFNYDTEDRVNKITFYYEEKMYAATESFIESFAIDYMSQDFIQITMVDSDEEYERDYAYLNEKGYVESYDGEEYTYDLSGYLHKVSYSNPGGNTGTATYRWRDGNISSVEERWGESQYMYAFQYNTNNRELINIDLPDTWYWFWHEILGSSPLSWIGLRGEQSKNYVTSITAQYPNGDKGIETFKWSYDNNGYPKICRIKYQSIDETGAIDETQDWLMEISYLDETGEVTPPQPVVKEEPIELYVDDNSIELGETLYFTVYQDGEAITSQCDIKCQTTGDYINSSYYTPSYAGTYTFVAQKGDLTSNQVTVNVTEPENSLPSNISKWVGTYTVTTDQGLVFDGENEPYLIYRDQTFNITIEYQSDRDLFNIYGLSILGSDYGLLARLDEDNNLTILDTYFIDDDEEDGLEYCWLFCYNMYYNPNAIFNEFTYFRYSAGLTLKMNVYGSVTLDAEDIIANDDEAMGSFVMTDIFLVDNNENTMSHLTSEYPIIYRAGEFNIRKVSNDISTTRTENSPKANNAVSQINRDTQPLNMVNL